jgi:hypothetical protein
MFVGYGMADDTNRAGHLNAILRRIAETLGIPISQFYQEGASPPAAELHDLIVAYSAISDAQGRQRVMNVARREAERCQGQQGAESSD